MRISPGVACGVVRAPSSKSYTHRALVAAFLSGRLSTIVDPLDSEDTRATARGLEALGGRVRFGESAWSIRPGLPRRRSRGTTIRCGRSGTTLRFLLSVAAREPRTIRFTGDPQLAGRPIEPLLSALERRGLSVRLPPLHRGLPLSVRGPIEAGATVLDTTLSSQFLSSLLLVLPTLAAPSRIRTRGASVSAPYVAATRSIMGLQGIHVRTRARTFDVPAPQRYRGGTIRVPGDASSAAYLWAAAAITGGDVTVHHVPARPAQADLAILEVFRHGGTRVSRTGDRVRVRGRLRGPIDIQLDDAPDLLPLLGALSAATPGRHWIRGATHAAGKESDRRRATARLVRALGGRATLTARTLRIDGTARPRSIGHAQWDDHRMVMSAAVGALAARLPSSIGDPRTVRKSFPEFWTVFRGLGIRCEVAR
ncbi:MAG: 3-phosphoshikimate 1-carboxyvinyltransferase [Thermoplasmata archaeon]|nr:3-phosphoshikimate 1-carboxyvinyltransferase [Thermoplasmata archaeon]